MPSFAPLLPIISTRRLSVAKLRSFTLESKTDVRLIQVGAVFLLISLFLLIRGSKQYEFPDGINPIGEITIEGKVHRRFAKALNWMKLKGAETVFSKDLVYTPKDSRAEVQLDNGIKLILEPSTLVEFDSQTKNQFGVVLIEGKGQVIGPGGKSHTLHSGEKASPLIPVPKYEAPALLPEPEIWHEEQVDLSIEFDLAKSSGLALLNELELPETLDTQTRLTDFELVLKEPRTGVQKGPFEFWFELEWNPVPISDVQYELEISRTSDFEVSFKYPTQKTMVEIHLVDSGRYFWRVVSRKDGDKIISAVRRFLVSNASKTITSELGE